MNSPYLVLVGCLWLTSCAFTPKQVCEVDLYVTGAPTILGSCEGGKKQVRVLCETEGGCYFHTPCKLQSLTITHDGLPIVRTTRSYPDGIPRRVCVHRRG